MLRGWCQGRRGRTEFDEDEDVERMVSGRRGRTEFDEDEDVERMVSGQERKN